MAFDKPLEQAERWDILVQQGSTFERTMDLEGLDLTPILAETLKINDAYAPALLDYLLYRAYLMDADSQANMMRVQMHYGAFAQGITGKIQADQASSPNVASV